MTLPRGAPGVDAGAFLSLTPEGFGAHASAERAWVRAWRWGDDGFVWRVTAPGEGERLERPRERPYGSRSGRHVRPRRPLTGTAEQWQALDALAENFGVGWRRVIWGALGLDAEGDS